MSLERVVVVGTGQAAQQAATSLRGEGFAGAITLIGDEPGLPYQRPPLSKAYMKEGHPERLLLKPAAFYERSAITVLDRTRVTAIDRAAREVATSDGGRHPYDHLILATGARNFRPPIMGVEHGEVVELRTLADADAIRARLPEARRAVVIGGGFIGLEFAAVARSAGLEVTVIEALDRLMARVVSPPISQRFLDAHRAAGIRVLFEALAVAIEPGREGRPTGVSLAAGDHVEGDLVLIATGVLPNAELAADAGLAVENGVVVDETLLTEDPAISAIGDCAAFPGPDGRRVRLESVQAATDHARHVARRLAKGERAPYAAVPWFWSDQGDLKLQIAGLPGGADERIALPEAEAADTVLSFRGGRLVAAETVNVPGTHMAARKLLARGAPTLDEVRAAGFDLRAMAKAAA
jgi:3-phenylpropionate/trans-cinnamate dioxygenase ferredoxin reductase component